MEQSRKTWENEVGAPGGNPTPPYHGLLAAVREANQKLPKERRLRVLAGDPPIEWEQVENRRDIAPFLLFRDEHFDQLSSPREERRRTFTRNPGTRVCRTVRSQR